MNYFDEIGYWRNILVVKPDNAEQVREYVEEHRGWPDDMAFVLNDYVIYDGRVEGRFLGDSIDPDIPGRGKKYILPDKRSTMKKIVQAEFTKKVEKEATVKQEKVEVVKAKATSLAELLEGTKF